MIKSICIVGGGTSGCIAALILKQAYPNMSITMLESSNIGIIGVGEGSTEHWKKFISHIGVTVSELIRECGATFKIGIKFTNWHGDGTHYWHSLGEQFGVHSERNGLPYTWMRMISEGWDPVDTAWKLSTDSRHIDPLHEIVAQYHFDTHKLNVFLHKLCKERMINVIDTEIEQVNLDESGNVNELIDTQGNRYSSDLYIDASGFRRIIGSKLGAKWIDCEDQLPMNSAIAFPTGYTKDIPSYTEATALSSGWCWRIPTQERYGNGYVFCDQFLNETQAFDEVQQHYKNNLLIKEPIQIGKKIKFGAGHVENYWIKNCVMIGLSGIFVEPLEASSIGTTIQQCLLLAPNLVLYEKNNDHTSKIYNDYMTVISKNIIDFIQLHYLTQRSDSKFWLWLKHNIKLTDFNREHLENFKKGFPNLILMTTHPMKLFSYLNYAQVMHGLRMFHNDKLKTIYDYHLAEYYTARSDEIFQETKDILSKVESYTHREALDIIKQRFYETKYKF